VVAVVAAAAVVVAVAVVATVTVARNRAILHVIALSQIHAVEPVVQVNKAVMAIWIRLGMIFFFVCMLLQTSLFHR